MTTDTKRLRELAEAATPGPWKWSATEGSDASFKITTSDHTLLGRDDARFIAAANPQAVIALLDQLAAANAEIERLREETLRLGTHSNLHEVREKQATEMCTWLTSENQRLRDALKLAEHLDGEMDDLLEQSEEDVVENAQLQTQLAAMTKARDEACEIATWLAGHPSMDCLALGTKKARIATLRKVGT
jgi:hypothetical protein